MASTKVVPYISGERVRLHGQPYRWAVIIEWPADAAEDVQRIKGTHVAVQLERRQTDQGETYQYWPRHQIRRGDEPDRPERKMRPFMPED